MCHYTRRAGQGRRRATTQQQYCQTVRNRLHEGGTRAQHPVLGPVLTTQHHAARLAFARESNWQVCHWCPVLFTDESRFTVSTCDRHERVWKCYAACNIIQHDQFGVGSMMVLGGIFLESLTVLHKLFTSIYLKRYVVSDPPNHVRP